MIDFKCLQCGAKMEAPDSELGKGQKCQICGSVGAVRRLWTYWAVRVLLVLLALLVFGWLLKHASESYIRS